LRSDPLQFRRLGELRRGHRLAAVAFVAKLIREMYGKEGIPFGV